MILFIADQHTPVESRLIRVLCRSGLRHQHEEADRYRERGASAADLEESVRERTTITTADIFEPHGLDAAALEQLVATCERIPT